MYSASRCTLAVAAAASFVLIAVVADYDDIAGYTPVSDVTPHSLLDLDMKEIEEGTDLLTAAGFAAAWRAYAVGGNSEKTDSIRTIRGFSLSAQEKLTGEKWFDIYEDYWGVGPDYADQFTASACNGTGTFANVAPVTRGEGCLKGAQYQNLWMYVVHELEDAVGDCRAGDLNANDGGPHAWDEAWAFYTGSTVANGEPGTGYMLHTLAQKRCEQFATCTADSDGSDISGTSQVNADMLELYNEGQISLLNGDCDAAESIKDRIVDLMTVPLLQGLLRYFYLADPQAGNGSDKEAAELWAFAASVLPRIHECDPEVADVVLSNTDISSPEAPMADGYAFVKEKLESVYSCMGISCGQVGGLVIGEPLTYYEGFEPCSGSGEGSVNKVLVSFLVIGAVAVVGVALGCFIRKRRSKKKTLDAMDANLGGFGAAKPATTL